MARLKETRARAEAIGSRSFPLSGDGGGDVVGNSLLGGSEEQEMRLQGSLGPAAFSVWTGSPICGPGGGGGWGQGTLLQC